MPAIYDKAKVTELLEATVATQGVYERALRELEVYLGVDMDDDVSDTLDTHDADTLIEWARKELDE